MENDVVVTGRVGVKDVRHGCHGSLEVHGAVLTRTVGAFIIPLDVVEGSISYGRFVRTGGVDAPLLHPGQPVEVTLENR
jgi:hypothetical protein